MTVRWLLIPKYHEGFSIRKLNLECCTCLGLLLQFPNASCPFCPLIFYYWVMGHMQYLVKEFNHVGRVIVYRVHFSYHTTNPISSRNQKIYWQINFTCDVFQKEEWNDQGCRYHFFWNNNHVHKFTIIEELSTKLVRHQTKTEGMKEQRERHWWWFKSWFINMFMLGRPNIMVVFLFGFLLIDCTIHSYKKNFYIFTNFVKFCYYCKRNSLSFSENKWWPQIQDISWGLLFTNLMILLKGLHFTREPYSYSDMMKYSKPSICWTITWTSHPINSSHWYLCFALQERIRDLFLG